METSLLNPNAPPFISPQYQKSILSSSPSSVVNTIYTFSPPQLSPYPQYYSFSQEFPASYNFAYPQFKPAVPPSTPLAVHNRRRVWVQKSPRPMVQAIKYAAQKHRPIVGVSHKLYEINCAAHADLDGNTTLMLKNIPNKFSKDRLIGILRNHCRRENEIVRASDGDAAVLSEIDYFYLPIDFSTRSNFGYCFVNCTTSVGAWRLYKYLHNHDWTFAGSHKKCEVNLARIQGLASCIRNADRMYFRKCIPDAYLPVHFEPALDGINHPAEYTHGEIL